MAILSYSLEVEGLGTALVADPSFLTKLLLALSHWNALDEGGLVDAIDAHLPPDASANARLHDFLSGLAARAGVLM